MMVDNARTAYVYTYLLTPVRFSPFPFLMELYKSGPAGQRNKVRTPPENKQKTMPDAKGDKTIKSGG